MKTIVVTLEMCGLRRSQLADVRARQSFLYWRSFFLVGSPPIQIQNKSPNQTVGTPNVEAQKRLLDSILTFSWVAVRNLQILKCAGISGMFTPVPSYHFAILPPPTQN